MRSLRKSLALLLALAMVLSAFAVTTVSAKTFSDTSGHWAETWIEKWSDNGVINGYEDGTFRPDDFITRAELAKIISTAKSYTALADIAFADVAGDEWYAADLKKCVAQGVIGGYEDGTFRPDEYITREEASAMFVRAYNINAIGMLNFADNNDISEWSKTAVTALVGAGVINGYEDGTFLPKATITRAEVVKILDGVDSVVVSFPQATNSTGGTNTVTTIGNLGNSGGSSGGGGGSSQSTPSYKVTFNANGGSFSDGKATASITIGRNSVIGSKAPQPVRAGMSFEGWYTSADAANELISSKKWDVNAAVTRNLTLYAGWYIEGKVVVSFETNGGSPAVPSQTIDSGSFAEIPNVNLTRAHYTFDGWYTKNVGGTKVNFSSTPIRINTRFYAKWTVDSDYADKEITIPNVTTGSYQNGTVEAVPPSVLPGETVTISITPPSGFEVEGIRSITYTSTETGEQSAIAESSIKYNEETGEFSFVMPEDVQKNSLAINPHYVASLPTEKPAPTAPPTATIDPTAPTPEAPKVPKYYFSKSEFDGKTVFPANEEIDGLTVNKDCDIDASNKTFSGSGYKYTKRCKIGTAALSFKVDGPCMVMIDAVSASSEDREYQLLAGDESLGSFVCLNGASNTATFYYNGSAQTLTIKPLKGINLYGIFVEYGVSIPTATPKPTVDPNIKYDINIADNIQNGSIVVSNGEVESDKIRSFTWNAEDHIPAGAVSGETGVFGTGKATVNLNDKDATDGTLTIFEEAHWYDHTLKSGETFKYIRGENNPSATVPFTETNQPGGAAFRLDAGQDGYLTLNIYIFGGKHFHLYDNNAKSHIEDFTTTDEDIYTFTFACEQSNSYYFWAEGSKVGIVSATYSTGILNAKAGQTITVKTKPDSGFKTSSVFTSPESSVSAGSAANTYTFKMPASDVTIGATFVDSSAQEYTVTAEKPENGNVSLEKEVSAAADSQTVIDTSENFLMSDGNGGKWIVSSDGTVGGTVSVDTTDVGGNSTEKMKLSDKAVQYVLDGKINSGVFELSYDFYDDNTAAAGRSFRTYLDNESHEYNSVTGQATAMGNTAAFFHMTDIANKVYVTDKASDVGIGTAAGTQIGDKELEASKWYRVVIKGNLDDGTLDIAYYLHGSDGQYNPDNISSTPFISSTEAKFTDDRLAEIAQVKFMRTAAGNLYYDNIKLTTSSAAVKTIKAFDGEVIRVVAEPDAGYELNEIIVKDTAGNLVDVNGDKFVMPKSDVNVTVTFVLLGTKPTPEPTLDPNKEYTVKVADGITGGTVKIVQPTAEPTALPATPAPATATPKPTVPPMTVIDEEYTFVSDDYTKPDADAKTATAISASTLLDNGRVYSESGNNAATNKNKSIIGGEQKYNSLRLKMENNTLLIDIGAESTITVYSNNDLAKDRHIILGTTPGGDDISKGLDTTETPYADSVKYVETKFENVPAGKIYISATGDLFIAGFTVTPVGGTAAASDITASAADEVLVDSLKAKAGQTITVKAIPDEANGKVEITTQPEVTVKDLGDGYYTFIMPAADTVVNAEFNEALSSATPYPSTTPGTETPEPSMTPGASETPGPSMTPEVSETPGPSTTPGASETPGPSTTPEVSETPEPSTTPIVSARTNFADNFLVKDGNVDGFYIGTDGSADGGAEETTEGQLKLTAKNMALYLPEAVDLEENKFELTYDYNINNTAYAGRSFRVYLGNSAIEKNETTGTESAAFSASADSVFFHLCDIGKSLYTSASSDTLSAKATGTGVEQVGTGSLDDATWYKVTITADKDSVSVKYVPYSDYTNGVLSDSAVIDGVGSYVPGAVKSLVSVRFMATAVANELYDNISYTITPSISTTP